MKMKRIITDILWLLGAVLLALFIVNFVGQRAKVDGDSMNPTLSDGDSVILEKVSYRFSEPNRYDIVVFPYKWEDGSYFIKRIIGLPGETIQIKDGGVFINEQRLEDDVYCSDMIQNVVMAKEPITLGEDEYFVLGDNRNNSRDSRYPDVGFIKKDEIVGKVFFRIFPFNEIGSLEQSSDVY